MCPPTNVPELRQFLGMANQLGKFTSNLVEMTQPLHELLSRSKSWIWNSAQSTAFQKVKLELSKPTTLTLYTPSAQTKISADASAFGLGAVLLQKSNSTWKAAAFASRLTSEMECRYAQREKEALATTWACEKFADFIIGKHRDRNRLQASCSPSGSKDLNRLPPRILRFRLRLDRFSYDIKHVRGKELYTADTLPWAPVYGQTSQDNVTQQDLAELCIMSTISHLPASNKRMEMYRKAQFNDPTCQQILKYCQERWPKKNQLDPFPKPYWEAQGELKEGEGVLMNCQRMVHGPQIIPNRDPSETIRRSPRHI